MRRTESWHTRDAVGVELVGPEEELRAESGGLSVRSGGNLERERIEFRVCGAEGVGDGGGLAAGERADGVDEATAGLQGDDDVVQECELSGGELADFFGRGGPAGVRIALPSADAAARGIEEDAIEFCF